MIIQTLVNLVIFAFFMVFSFQAMHVISTPMSIEPLKLEYLQLQIDTLSTYYIGAYILEDQVCFTHEICLSFKNERLILVPGHQILLENIQEYYVTQEGEFILLNFQIKDQWNKLHVKQK